MPRKTKAESAGGAAKRGAKAPNGRTKGARKPGAAGADPAPRTDSDVREAIRQRAYELYLARQAGALDDWLRAEREILGTSK